MPKKRKSNTKSSLKAKPKRMSIAESSRPQPHDVLTKHQSISCDTVSSICCEIPIYTVNMTIEVILILVVHYLLMTVKNYDS